MRASQQYFEVQTKMAYARSCGQVVPLECHVFDEMHHIFCNCMSVQSALIQLTYRLPMSLSSMLTSQLYNIFGRMFVVT